MSSSGICWVSWCRLVPYLRSIAGLFAFYLRESQVFPVPSLGKGLWILCRKTCLTGFIQAVPVLAVSGGNPPSMIWYPLCTCTWTLFVQIIRSPRSVSFACGGHPRLYFPSPQDSHQTLPFIRWNEAFGTRIYVLHAGRHGFDSWMVCAVRTSLIQSISVSHKWCRGCTFCRR